jgi:hypothetical protein
VVATRGRRDDEDDNLETRTAIWTRVHIRMKCAWALSFGGGGVFVTEVE